MEATPHISRLRIARAKTNCQPSEAQKRAGNYSKGKVYLHGLTISIENPKGSMRTGIDKDGRIWASKLAADYGYVNSTLGADDDQVDVYIGPQPQSELVFVIDQVNPDRNFDEHKCVLGCLNLTEARQLYLANYPDGWKGIGAITPMHMSQFKHWLFNHDTTRPLGTFLKANGSIEAGDWFLKGKVRGYTTRSGKVVREYERSDRSRSEGKEDVSGLYGGWEPKWRTPTPEEFVELRDRTENPQFLSGGDAASLADHELLVSHDGKVGVAVSPDGEIKNLFNNGGPRRAGSEAVFWAIDHGGAMLDCYSLWLHRYYAQFGFVEIGRAHFDRKEAHPKWNYERDKEPDVVFMVLSEVRSKQSIRAILAHPQGEWPGHEKSGKYYGSGPEEWERAKADCRRAVSDRLRREDRGPGVRGETRGGDSGPGSSDRRDLKKAGFEFDELGRIFIKADVQHPGSRGGRYWVDKQGHVRYGDRPTPLGRTKSGLEIHGHTHPSLATFEGEHRHWKPHEHQEAAELLRQSGTDHHHALAAAHSHLAERKASGRSSIDEAKVDQGLIDSWKRAYAEHRENQKREQESAEPKEAAPTPKPAAPAQPVAKEKAPEQSDYAYRDVGYVPGSRKELAEQSIKLAAKEGKQVHWQDVDWNSLEENPRVAKALITKSNVFGDVDWSGFEASGMEPGSGYLVRAVYAAVGTEPDAADLARRQASGGEDSGRAYDRKRAEKQGLTAEGGDVSQARQDYVRGINTLRERMERCRTPDDVIKAVEEIDAERNGVTLNAEESDRYAAAVARSKELRAQELAYRAVVEPLANAWNAASSNVNRVKWEQEKRTRRGWKPDPDLDAEIKRAEAERDKASEVWASARRPDEDKQRDQEQRELYAIRQKIEIAARKRNLAENPITRAWHALGPRFAQMLAFRQSAGSEAFARNVAEVKAGKVKDWSWSKTEPKKRSGATKESTRFQLLVADSFERTGGAPVPIGSSADLQKRFNLRAVQSGNWVLRDVNSGKFHMEQCGAAFADLAELVGIEPEHVSMNGRLAVAFGARGTGSTGGNAHYEPVHRVINITKMAGAGALAHEWFHAVDNLMMAVHGVEEADTFATHLGEHNGKLSPELRSAVKTLHAAMTEGSVRKKTQMSVMPDDDRLVAANMSEQSLAYGSGWRQTIARASSLDDAVQKLESMAEQGRFGKGPKAARQLSTVKRIAAAWWTKDQAGKERSVTIESGPAMSQYMADAMELNASGMGGKEGYWSSPHELGARAFGAFVEDKLSAAGRRNDYLSFKSDNAYYRMLELRPYPEGEERIRINKAFEGLFAALRKENTFQKAGQLLSAKPTLWQRLRRRLAA